MERVMEAATALLSARHALPADADAAPAAGGKRARKHGQGKRKPKQRDAPAGAQHHQYQREYASTLQSHTRYAGEFASNRPLAAQRYSSEVATCQQFHESRDPQLQVWQQVAQHSLHTMRQQDISQILAQAEPTPEFAKPMYAPRTHNPPGQAPVQDRRSVTAVIQPGQSIVPEVYRRQPNIIDIDPRLRGLSSASYGLTAGHAAHGSRLLPPFRHLSGGKSTSSTVSTKNHRFPSPSFPSADVRLGPQRFMWSQSNGLPQNALSHSQKSSHEGYPLAQRPPHILKDSAYVDCTLSTTGSNRFGPAQSESRSRHQTQSHAIDDSHFNSHFHLQPARHRQFQPVGSFDHNDSNHAFHRATMIPERNQPAEIPAFSLPVSKLVDCIRPELESTNQFENAMWSKSEDLSQAARTITSSFQSSANVPSMLKPLFANLSDPLSGVLDPPNPEDRVLASQPTNFRADYLESSPNEVLHSTVASHKTVASKPKSANRLRKIAKQSWRQERREKMKAEKERSAKLHSTELNNENQRTVPEPESLLYQQTPGCFLKSRSDNKSKDKRKANANQSVKPQGLGGSAGARASGPSSRPKDFRIASSAERYEEEMVRGAHLAMLANQQLQQRNPVDSNSQTRPNPTVVVRSASSSMGAYKRARLEFNPPEVGNFLKQSQFNLKASFNRSLGENGLVSKPVFTVNSVTESSQSGSGEQCQVEHAVNFPPCSSQASSASAGLDPQKSFGVVGGNLSDNEDRESQIDRVVEMCEREIPSHRPIRINSCKLNQTEVFRLASTSAKSSPSNGEVVLCNNSVADHTPTIQVPSQTSTEFARTPQVERSAAFARRLEPETVMIFCKRDFLRFQAGRLWRKFQEIKRKRDLSLATVTGRRARYMNARYRSSEHLGQRSKDADGEEEVDRTGKEAREPTLGDEPDAELGKTSNEDVSLSSEEAFETKANDQERCTTVDRLKHNDHVYEISTRQNDREENSSSGGSYGEGFPQQDCPEPAVHPYVVVHDSDPVATTEALTPSMPSEPRRRFMLEFVSSEHTLQPISEESLGGCSLPPAQEQPESGDTSSHVELTSTLNGKSPTLCLDESLGSKTNEKDSSGTHGDDINGRETVMEEKQCETTPNSMAGSPSSAAPAFESPVNSTGNLHQEEPRFVADVSKHTDGDQTTTNASTDTKPMSSCADKEEFDRSRRLDDCDLQRSSETWSRKNENEGSVLTENDDSRNVDFMEEEAPREIILGSAPDASLLVKESTASIESLSNQEPTFVTIEEDTFGEWQDTTSLPPCSTSEECSPTSGPLKALSSEDLNKRHEDGRSDEPVNPSTSGHANGEILFIQDTGHVKKGQVVFEQSSQVIKTK